MHRSRIEDLLEEMPFVPPHRETSNPLLMSSARALYSHNISHYILSPDISTSIKDIASSQQLSRWTRTTFWSHVRRLVTPAHEPAAQMKMFALQQYLDDLGPLKNVLHYCPGEVAANVLELPYECAMKGEKYNSELVRLLQNTPPAREPFIRSSRQWATGQEDRIIHSKIANVESALIQIVGKKPPVECDSCLKKDGPWAKCIIVEGAGPQLTACGNCQYEGTVGTQFGS